MIHNNKIIQYIIKEKTIIFNILIT